MLESIFDALDLNDDTRDLIKVGLVVLCIVLIVVFGLLWNYDVISKSISIPLTLIPAGLLLLSIVSVIYRAMGLDMGPTQPKSNVKNTSSKIAYDQKKRQEVDSWKRERGV